MICVIATFPLKQGNVEQAVELATELVNETRKEKGCVRYDLLQADDNADVLVISEVWETQEDLDVHSASAHFGRLVPKMADLCAEAVGVKSYRQLV